MNSSDYFQTLARYNLWATRRLLHEHIAHLSEDEYRRDAGLFFKSIHGTLNHLYVAEHLLWRRRFAAGESPRLALNTEAFSDRAELAAALEEGAAQWQPLVASWPEERFENKLSYVSTKGIPIKVSFIATLAHVFNHGTHHRGQISAALTAMSKPCPELDMIWMLQAESKAHP